MKVEPLFDFEKGDFVIGRNGSVQLVTGKEELKNWICKAMHTAINRYRIYEGSVYGNRLEELLVGKTLPRAYALAEAERYTREAICQHPEVFGVDGFSLKKDGALVSITCKVISVYGNTDYSEVIEIG